MGNVPSNRPGVGPGPTTSTRTPGSQVGWPWRPTHPRLQVGSRLNERGVVRGSWCHPNRQASSSSSSPSSSCHQHLKTRIPDALCRYPRLKTTSALRCDTTYRVSLPSTRLAARCGCLPATMKEFLDSDRVNFLIWRCAAPF
jgi:hypothetical protein